MATISYPKIALGTWAWGNDGTFGSGLSAADVRPVFEAARAAGLNLTLGSPFVFVDASAPLALRIARWAAAGALLAEAGTVIGALAGKRRSREAPARLRGALYAATPGRATYRTTASSRACRRG